MKLKNNRNKNSYFQEHQVSLDLVCLEDNSYHILCKVGFGTQEGLMIVDTGASISVVDAGFAKEMSVELVKSQLQSRTINGSIEDISVIKHHDVRVGGINVGRMKFATLDLSAVNEMYEKQVSLRVIGLIGSDFLQRYKAILDYGQQKMIFKTQRF